MPSIIDDILTVIFWSIAYLLIVFAGFRSRSIKKVSMPYVAGVLNIAWEICALYWVSGFWGYILWFVIDLFIVFFGFCFLNSIFKRIAYIVSIAFFTVILFFTLKIPDGMIYSVFLIDLVMAVCFIVERKKLSPRYKIPIAVAKLLGDFFAGFVFNQFVFVVIVAILVFVLNSVYLWICIKESIANTKGGDTYAG